MKFIATEGDPEEDELEISTQDRHRIPKNRRFRVDYENVVFNDNPEVNAWDTFQNNEKATFTYSLPTHKFQYISLPFPQNMRVPASSEILKHGVSKLTPDVIQIDDNNSSDLLVYLVDSIIQKHATLSPQNREITGAAITIKVFESPYYGHNSHTHTDKVQTSTTFGS